MRFMAITRFALAGYDLEAIAGFKRRGRSSCRINDICRIDGSGLLPLDDRRSEMSLCYVLLSDLK